MTEQLTLFGSSDFVVAPTKPGVYQYAAILFTSLGGTTKGKQTHWPLSASIQSCTCDCEDCEFLDHCSEQPCEFSDVLPDNAVPLLDVLKDKQRMSGIEPDARFAWRRIIVGPWEEV